MKFPNWVALFLSILWTGISNGRAADPVIFAPAERSAEIRQELLRFTPIGSTTEQVLDFVQSRLPSPEAKLARIENHPATGAAAESSPRKGVTSLKVFIGNFLVSPFLLTLSPPLPLEAAASAQWAFDKDGKLIEIFVERKITGP